MILMTYLHKRKDRCYTVAFMTPRGLRRVVTQIRNKRVALRFRQLQERLAWGVADEREERLH